jgi:Ca2+-binding RTX toxin-like protein
VLYGFTGSADLGGVETVTLNPLAGTDNVTVRDLGGTATTKIDVNLSTADLRVDTVTAIGTQGADSIKATTNGTTQTIGGLPATVDVLNPERGEKVAIDARDGADTIDATGIVRDKIQPALKGGAGNDVLIGTPGDDTIAGGVGVDVALMGGGLDTFTWAPGDGNDVVEGQAGTDFLQMNGSGGNDRFDVLPVGGRTRVTRDIENVNVDLGGVERVDLLPWPGGDIVHVADLSGTATNRVDVNLMVARGQIGGDDLIDRVFVDGTFGTDTINVNGAGPDVRVSGLANITTVRGTDPELDRLHVDTKPGVDALTVTGTTNQLIGFTFS